MTKSKEKYCNIVLINLSVENFVDEICTQTWLLYEKKNSQIAYLKHLKLVLPEDHALVLLDAVQNQLSNPDAIQ